MGEGAELPSDRTNRGSLGRGKEAPYRSSLALSGLFWGLLGLVLLAPLPFGSVHRVSWLALTAGVALLLLAWSVVALRRDLVHGLGSRLLGLSAGGFLLVLAWIAVQAASFTPQSLHHPVWAAAATLLDAPVSSAISLEPEATLSAGLRLAGYGAVFWLSFQLCRSRRRCHRAFVALGPAIAGYATYGLWAHLGGSGLVLWHEKQSYLDSLTGSYINRNSFATFLGIGLVVTTTLVLRYCVDLLQRHRSLRQVLLLSIGSWSYRTVVVFVAWCILLSALLLTNSRAGVVSTALAILTLFVLQLRSAAHGRGTLAIVAVVMVVFAGVFLAVSGEELWIRILTAEHESRFRIYAATLQAIAERPWLGTGFGTFEDAIQMWQGPESAGYVAKGHNSYLETAMELGVPAAILLTLAIAGPAIRCLVVAPSSSGRVGIPEAGVAATVLVGLHSTLDFSLQIPANAVVYAFVMGLAATRSLERAH